MDLDASLYAYLAADAPLLGLLATYRSAPAIFTEPPVPDDADLPYIVINSISDVPFDTLAEEGRNVIRDIGCYARFTGSSAPIIAIAERVRSLLHSQTILVPGYANIVTSVVGVANAPTDRTVSGRIVSTRFLLRKI